MVYTRISARAILITQEGKVCLIKRTKNGEVYWVAPGGGIEDGETPLDAVKRELLEETGSVCSSCEKAFEFENLTFFLCYEKSRGIPSGQEYELADENNQYEVVDIDVEMLPKISFRPEKLKTQIYELAKELGL